MTCCHFMKHDLDMAQQSAAATTDTPRFHMKVEHNHWVKSAADDRHVPVYSVSQGPVDSAQNIPPTSVSHIFHLQALFPTDGFIMAAMVYILHCTVTFLVLFREDE